MLYADNKKEDIQSRLITVRKMAEYLGIVINGAYKLCKQKDFPCIKIGNKKFVDMNKLDDWIDNHYLVNEKCEHYKLGDMWMCESCKSVCKFAGKVFDEYDI